MARLVILIVRRSYVPCVWQPPRPLGLFALGQFYHLIGYVGRGIWTRQLYDVVTQRFELFVVGHGIDGQWQQGAACLGVGHVECGIFLHKRQAFLV